MAVTSIQALLEANNGIYPDTTELGGYPLFYIDREESIICADCANGPDSAIPIIGVDINWEDDSLYCDGCSLRIESAYHDRD